MNDFLFEKVSIEGAYLIQSFISEDNRGNFVKNFEQDTFEKNNIIFNCTEDFITESTKYVIRGMHFQTYHPQKKLVSVLRGKVYDVIVDLRKESKTYKKWEGFYLSASNRMSLLIPRGCAHGFMALSEESTVCYKCDGKYDKKTDTGIIYNDYEIGIEWPICDNSRIVLSNRDKNLMSFREFEEKCSFELGEYE